MAKARLAIGIPSNRPYAQSGPSIESAVQFCRLRGYALVVSDNSGDADKAQKLRALMTGEGMTYLETPPCGMMENWTAAYDATAGADFVLMMGDDDTIHAYGPTKSYTSVPADVAGIRPAIFGYAEGAGILRVTTGEIKSTVPAQRIVEYLNSAKGSNMGIFTFWRRDVFKSVMDLLMGPHPTHGTYCDWAMMNALVSSGRVIADPGSSYYYNFQNWVGPPAHVQAQVEKAYTKAGLPAGASAYERIFNAVDSFIFINRKDAPITPQERTVAGAFCLDMYIKNYLKALPLDSRHANAAAILAISRKLEGLDGFAEIFAVFDEMMEAIQPVLGARYKDFYLAATGRAWGDF